MPSCDTTNCGRNRRWSRHARSRNQALRFSSAHHNNSESAHFAIGSITPKARTRQYENRHRHESSYSFSCEHIVKPSTSGRASCGMPRGKATGLDSRSSARDGSKTSSSCTFGPRFCVQASCSRMIKGKDRGVTRGVAPESMCFTGQVVAICEMGQARRLSTRALTSYL
jgi:hypothetical protein